MVEIKLHKVSELSSGQGNVNVSGVIKELGEVRSFNKYGRELRVVNAIFEDSSGSIKLTLWNDDCAKFHEGDKVKIVNGYVSEFQGEKQLTSGKFGRIEKDEPSQNSDSEENSSSEVVKPKVKQELEESEEEFSDAEAPSSEEEY